MEKILIVDDEHSICELLKTELELEGYECIVVYDGEEAIECYEQTKPDLILLDIMLPSMSGYEVCDEITKRGNVPIIMLTAKSEMQDKVRGLEGGADDYITKPFDTAELLARIKALIRRYNNVSKPTDSVYKNGSLSLYPDSQSVTIDSTQLHLTVTEFELLLLFLKNRDKVLSREALANQIGIKNFALDTRSIDMHIQRLRRKLAEYTDIKYIETVFGMGYKMRSMDENTLK